ncbi:Protein fam13a [Balamuthia mandrillaris]
MANRPQPPGRELRGNLTARAISSGSMDDLTGGGGPLPGSGSGPLPGYPLPPSGASTLKRVNSFGPAGGRPATAYIPGGFSASSPSLFPLPPHAPPHAPSPPGSPTPGSSSSSPESPRRRPSFDQGSPLNSPTSSSERAARPAGKEGKGSMVSNFTLRSKKLAKSTTGKMRVGRQYAKERLAKVKKEGGAGTEGGAVDGDSQLNLSINPEITDMSNRLKNTEKNIKVLVKASKKAQLALVGFAQASQQMGEALNGFGSFESEPLGSTVVQYGAALQNLGKALESKDPNAAALFGEPLTRFKTGHITNAHNLKSKYDRVRLQYDANRKDSEVVMPGERKSSAEQLENTLRDLEIETIQKLREVEERKHFELINTCSHYMEGHIQLFEECLAMLKKMEPVVKEARNQAQIKRREFVDSAGNYVASSVIDQRKSSFGGRAFSTFGGVPITPGGRSGRSPSVVDSPWKTFGEPLKKVLDRETPRPTVPVFVTKAISYLQNYLKEEGLFRISGGVSDVNKVKERVDTMQEYELDDILDPHTIASLLKLFFRELPEAVVPEHMNKRLLAATKLEDDKELQVEYLRAMLPGSLPADNAALLHTLFHFLAKVAKQEEFNKMGTSNLATVFGPNIIRDENSGMLSASHADILTITELAIAHVDEVFPEDTSVVEPTYEMEAIYDYDAQDAQRELYLRTGDVICVWGPWDEEWVYGELNGNIGLAPLSFLKERAK